MFSRDYVMHCLQENVCKPQDPNWVKIVTILLSYICNVGNHLLVAEDLLKEGTIRRLLTRARKKTITNIRSRKIANCICNCL
jgi:hypothetical protein